jgi:AraC-like DNA-binding protein
VPRAILVPKGDRAEWVRRLDALATELRDRPRGFREVARAELKILLVRAARLATPDDAPEALSPLLGEVFDVIERRFADRLSLSDVARNVGRSPAYLTSVVRRETGLTVQAWIIERRMAEARQRLLTSDEAVVVVAERAGYGDPTLFIRHFKRAHGMTPKEWRKAAALA